MTTSSRQTGAEAPFELFQEFPYALLLTAPSGRVMEVNVAARELLGSALEDEGEPLRCCDLLGCHRPGTALANACASELGARSRRPLPEVRVDLPGEGRAAWVTAAQLPSREDRVLIHLRPGRTGDRRRRTDPHWTGDARLDIIALGRTQVFSAEGSLGGKWLNQRPGQVLKYLLCERGRVVHAEEIAETLWPAADHRAVGNVRHFVHVLREHLEPGRQRRSESRFIVAERGGYRLDLDHVAIDADAFADAVRLGLAAYRADRVDDALRHLERGITLYGGEFLAEERYALWVSEERERLRELAAQALRTLSDIHWTAGDLHEASRYLERAADMQPFDSDVQRSLIELALARGRHSQARRRYVVLRARMLQEFGQEPDFSLADVADAVAEDARDDLPPRDRRVRP
jgi:DNA-binding SARP family transcriptional activator